ncbi:MAG: SH3 domain-containing protein [Paracoccaceae bacterium]|nr:SH3 domain-containing protein [Paracoccaceae bacterium]
MTGSNWGKGFTVLIVTLSLMAARPATAQEATEDRPETSASVSVAAPIAPRDPGRGAVTNLPLPRYVSLKTGEGNARRGPGRTHRIDWVFNRAGMPLRITAEHENWRRVEDSEGAGGWVHYSLLSGVRSVLVAEDMVMFRSQPDDAASEVLQAERGVIARLLECQPDWCRLGIDGSKGWVRKTALWGVDPGEEVE